MAERERDCRYCTHMHVHNRRETYLFKMVHTEDASGVPTMGPYLLAETRGVPNVAFRKFLWFRPLFPGGQSITNRWLAQARGPGSDYQQLVVLQLSFKFLDLLLV